ncbi:MAG: 4'-phosphopantetheinyl transferase superfamily protein [Saprospiraceae bacterium]|nr:4'-phosphopantetheinyl transferase superfamily protein [Saprospiraceae bacterium]
MLGNDIIDLREVLATGQAKRPGFKERICLDMELKPLNTQFSEEYCIWLLWAIKESAYKYYIQAGGQPLFAPKKFQFQPKAIATKLISGLTHTPAGSVHSVVYLSGDYLRAESWSMTLPHPSIHRHLYFLDATTTKGKSKQLKYLIGKQLGAELGYQAEDISIQKDYRQVPYLFHRKQQLPYSISLSHHGTWGLFSYLQENSPSLG